MQITEVRSRELLAQHRVFANEACDRCGRILGCVRFTIAGSPGAWCSRLCRDGAEASAARKGGRPRKHKNEAERQKSYRGRLRALRNPFENG
jgi:hypothetical protein